jgi:hypothetical protein
MLRALLLALTLSFVLAGAHAAHAQFGGGVQVVSLSISPQYPRPYETVTVTPSSNLIDLSASTVSISVNGKLIEKGTGTQSVPVTVGGPGGRTTIVVSAVNGGQTYTAQLDVHPADVSLVVEPVSTTHPFYLGAALLPPEGRVRVIALPDLRTSANVRLDPSTLTYTWKFGDQVLQSESGIGHSILSATGPVRYRDAQITLTVASSDNSIVAQASTVLAPVDPLVRIYQTDPLMGTLYEHALTDAYRMSAAETSFTSAPYFFASTPTITWSLNGTDQGNDTDITVRSTGSGAGTASLGVKASDAAGQQTAATPLSILFGQAKTNLFGF